MTEKNKKTYDKSIKKSTLIHFENSIFSVVVDFTDMCRHIVVDYWDMMSA